MAAGGASTLCLANVKTTHTLNTRGRLSTINNLNQVCVKHLLVFVTYYFWRCVKLNAGYYLHCRIDCGDRHLLIISTTARGTGEIESEMTVHDVMTGKERISTHLTKLYVGVQLWSHILTFKLVKVGTAPG